MWHTNKVSFLNLFTLLLGAVESSAQPSTQWPQQTFKSTPLEAPYLNVTKNGKTELGYLFFSPSNSNWSYPTIYQDDGQLVWRGPLVNTSAEQPQMLNGEPVLAYWNGANIKGFGFGSISILNSSYDEIYKVTLPGTEEKFVTVLDPVTYPSYIDIHESQITDQGTILVTAVNVTQMDLSSIGGPKDGWVQDGLFYEIDIKTNDVLFRWSTVEHLSEIPLSNNELPLEGKGTNKTTPYEYPHLNSVAKYGDSYLISSRFMCSFFFIDKNGNVTWHLHGQKGGDFTLTPGTSFCYQHDPRFESQTEDKITIHFHNNENADFTSETVMTTGMTIALDMKTKIVTLVDKLWDAEQPVYAESQGSYQNLTNGHVLMQHGAVPKLEEYDENGALVMRAWFGYHGGTKTYRGYRFPWVGKPRTKPDVAACSSEGKMVVYVSWNGATDVQEWKVLGGSEEGKMKKVTMVPRNGFETRIAVDEVVEKVVVEAVGGVGDGRRSEVVTVGQSC
ncbi:ASST-domain-containing protein [Aspergillus parasiticus]|uniref:ASST-domain-containing protein n=1 Tax=Aspergillus parasiticus TaxID=5067 RepID=A0A5N6DJD2_ASPPA|nr:ASST-domain-containing protein [Aspergillus parasiticus]